VFFPFPTGNSGKALVDNLRLDIDSGPDYPNTTWQTYATTANWTLSSSSGYKTVYAQVQDKAGNRSAVAAKSIVLDTIPPIAIINFPGPGQVITSSQISVLGAADDPPVGSLSLSHFSWYKLTWRLAAGPGSDTNHGILPESLFYVSEPPDTNNPFYPYPSLAFWNTQIPYNRYGQNQYYLMLTAQDSAGNQTTFQVPVMLQLGPGGPPGQPGPGGMGPMAMTATPNNPLYVGTSGGTLLNYTTSFDSVSSLSLADSSGPAQITGVGADSSGSLWISDARNLNVRRYSQNGTLKSRIGSSKRFARPNGVCPARNGNVWIADRYHNQISVYDSSGNLKLSFGTYGSDTGQFNRPTGLTLNHKQNCCYVVDSRNQRIQVFDTTGRYLTSFGSPYLSLPVAITLDTNNCAYVADSGAQALFGFDPKGDLYLTLQQTDTLLPIAATTTSDNGYLFTYDRKHQNLMKYLVVCTDTSRMGGGIQSSGATPGLLPKELTLYPSFPNPANGRLTIRYAVPRTTRLSIKVYDVSGQRVRTLVTNQTTRPGFYNVTWDGKDSRNRQLGNGVYFCRLESNEPRAWSSKPSIQVRTRKLVIAR
jgi:streptogramin lyase